MELYQLRYALAVLRNRSFTKAAEELPVSVASVSEAVKSLESELGVSLFERTTRTVRPTLVGELFLGRIADVLALIDASTRDLSEYGQLPILPISLGTAPVAGLLNLPTLIACFLRDHLNMQLRIVEAHDNSGLFQSLRSHDADMALLIVGPTGLPDDIETHELQRAETGVVVAPGHPLASYDSVELANLANSPMLLPSVGSTMREIALEVCQRARIQPHVILETNLLSLLHSLVRADIGFTFLSHPVARAVRLPFLHCDPRPQDCVLKLAWLRESTLSRPATLLRDRICSPDVWLVSPNLTETEGRGGGIVDGMEETAA